MVRAASPSIRAAPPMIRSDLKRNGARSCAHRVLVVQSVSEKLCQLANSRKLLVFLVPNRERGDLLKSVKGFHDGQLIDVIWLQNPNLKLTDRRFRRDRANAAPSPLKSLKDLIGKFGAGADTHLLSHRMRGAAGSTSTRHR